MNISKACKTLMIREPFYGLFLSSLNKIFDNSIPTLAVGLQGININLYINEKFWNRLKDEEQLAVLKHELMHICFFHLTMRKSFGNHKLFNYASDLEINQLIENLPAGCITLDYFRALGIDLPEKAGTAYYYKVLQDNKFDPDQQDPDGDESDGGEGNQNADGNGGSENGNQGSNRGSHDKWKVFDELSESEKQLVQNQTDYILKNTAETILKNQGKIPSEMMRKIDELFAIKPALFNWKSYFRRLLGNSNFVYTKKSLRKLSKRFEDSAGIKVKQKTNILVAIDTSGSISLQELKDFFSEINHIYKAGAKVTIIECDSAIHRQYEYKGEFDGKISGGGGTDFAPVVEYYNAHRKDYTSLVFFTDGYASITNFKLKKQMIWVISSNGAQDQKYPGVTIKIPKQ